MIDLCRFLSIVVLETIKSKLFGNYLATVCKRTFSFLRNIGIRKPAATFASPVPQTSTRMSEPLHIVC